MWSLEPVGGMGVIASGYTDRGGSAVTETPAAEAIVPESVVIEVELGADGRVLIPREIRERIGIEPGWIAR